ncbi:PspA/IM30 family protein [Actinocrinis sp.]|uniref:PspA/IM30 family protein n=1 Tax=Actinocrinis sp. TaxID=1920516 RepID=UPI002D453272|nr:PspA/IM30 family protein [Actinocrinis sp.]HZP51651.1 PspA/IM30 family protein [Actinocrinis sp.]
MGVLQRIAASARARAHRVLDRFDEPAAAFDRARALQLSLLSEASNRLAASAAEAAALRVEVRREQERADRWAQSAREQLAAGGESAARAALAQWAGAVTRLERLRRQDEALRVERDGLTELSQRLEGRLAEFGALAETVRAADAAARAERELAVIATEAEELRRAVDRTARRAAPRGLDEELGELETAALVEAQLRRLKAESRHGPRASGGGGSSRSTSR